MKTKKHNNLLKKAEKCTKCPLGATRKNIVFYDGSVNAPVFFIGEAPGKNEDEEGIPFIGRAGQLLRNYIKQAGFRQEDYYIANTVKCRPPENRKPTAEEKLACFEFLKEQIKLINPKIIVLVGSVALESFIYDKKLTISKARGQIFEKEGRRFFPIFHPSYLLRQHREDIGSPRDLFKKDLLKIKEIINEYNTN